MKNKKIVLLILLLTGIMFYNSSATIIKTNKQTKLEDQNRFLIFTDVLLNVNKTDENDNFLPGVTFKLKSYNDIFEWTLEEQESNYSINKGDIKDIQDIREILSNSQMKVINSIKTLGDIKENVKNISEPDLFDGEDGNTQAGINIFFPTLFTLEETVVPTGYVKDKIYILGGISLWYETTSYDQTNPNNSPVKIVDSYLSTYSEDGSFLPYNDYNDEVLIGTDPDKAYEFWENNAIMPAYDCRLPSNLAQADEELIGELDKQISDAVAVEVPHAYAKKYNNTPVAESGSLPEIASDDKPNNPIPQTDLPICQIDLKGIKGEVNLKVENKVNETTSLTTTNNTNLTYKVILKNTGNVDAIDNTLTSKIPEGFEYIEGSASDGGVYKDGEIIWNVKRLEQGKDKTFTFRVHVPKGTDLSKSYIGESSVTNSSMQNRVESEKTVVKLSLINPNTLAPIAIISVVLLSLLLLIIQVLKHNKKQIIN